MRIRRKPIYIALASSIIVAFAFFILRPEKPALKVKFIGYAGNERFIIIQFGNDGADNISCFWDDDWITVAGPPFYASTLNALRHVYLEGHEVCEVKLSHLGSTNRPHLHVVYYKKPSPERIKLENRANDFFGLDLTRFRRVTVSVDIPEVSNIFQNLEPFKAIQLTNVFEPR